MANAEGIFDRKIGGFCDISKKKVMTDNIEPQEVSGQRGWQGINTNDYVGVYYNGSSGLGTNGHNDADALEWRQKLSDILLDKALLFSDKNLNILIHAAGELFFDEKKISLEQFANVILMLRYAYELRKLPNEKDGNLNLNVKQITLDNKSHTIVSRLLSNIDKEFKQLLENIKGTAPQDPANEGNLESFDVNMFNTSNTMIKNEDERERVDGKKLDAATFQNLGSKSSRYQFYKQRNNIA